MQFIDLQAQRRRIENEINTAIQAVIEHGRYVLGPEVMELEKQLGEYGHAERVVTCANGTEALALPLMAWGLRPGDVVFCPSFTFVATAQVVPWLGAIPCFVDIDPDTLNLKSKGQWITAYITLPAGYSVYDIDINTLAITSLEGLICSPTYTQPADIDNFFPQVGDRDEDEIPDLTVKFDRQVLIENLCLDDVAIIVEFSLIDGTRFVAEDSIRVIDRGK